MERKNRDMEKKMSYFDAIMAIENGEFESEEDFLAAWQTLIDSGTVWKLQGYYGRTAADLIRRGLCKAA